MYLYIPVELIDEPTNYQTNKYRYEPSDNSETIINNLEQ